MPAFAGWDPQPAPGPERSYETDETLPSRDASSFRQTNVWFVWRLRGADHVSSHTLSASRSPRSRHRRMRFRVLPEPTNRAPRRFVASVIFVGGVAIIVYLLVWR